MIDVYWLEKSEADVPSDDTWLSPDETTRLSGMRFPKRRADWRLGRWTAKCALATYLKIPADRNAFAELEIRSTASWAPQAFICGKPAAVVISLSHRQNVAMCAVAPSGVALGCDLELVEARSQAFVEDCFTREEIWLLSRFADNRRCRITALLWSAKESALKALGLGLQMDVRSLAVAGLADTSCQDIKQVATDNLKPTTSGQELGQGWRRLQVRGTECQIFHGWWQESGGLVRTLVAAPPPSIPILLDAQV